MGFRNLSLGFPLRVTSTAMTECMLQTALHTAWLWPGRRLDHDDRARLRPNGPPCDVDERLFEGGIGNAPLADVQLR